MAQRLSVGKLKLSLITWIWASLIAQLVKNLPTGQETPVQFLGQEDPWRRDRLPTPVFLGFPGGSADKDSACNVGDLASIPGLGRSCGERKGYPLHSGLENPRDLYSQWGHKASDTELLSLSLYVRFAGFHYSWVVDDIQFIYFFSFVVYTFDVISKKFPTNLTSWKFKSMFSAKTFVD